MTLPHTTAHIAAIPQTQQLVMHAKDGRRAYRIFLYTPTGPEPIEGYPVMYVLDANSVMGTFVEAARLQTKPPHGFALAVIVGIGYETDQPFDAAGRFYDYTMPTDRASLPPRKNGSPWPETGGAEAFLDFLEDQVKPDIASRVKINPSQQTLFGHSLGGLFAFYTMFTRTGMFQTYIAGSPSIWWNNRYVAKLAKGFVRQAAEEPQTASISLFIGLGGREHLDMIAEGEEMSRVLAPLSEKGMRLAYTVFEDEGHVSVLPALITRALRFAFDSRS